MVDNATLDPNERRRRLNQRSGPCLLLVGTLGFGLVELSDGTRHCPIGQMQTLAGCIRP